MKVRSSYSTVKSPDNIKRQGGWTFWSLTFTLSVVIFFSYIGMQLVPIYSSNSSIENAMERSVDGADLRKISRAQIIKKMNAQLYLDGSQKLLDYKNDLVISRKGSLVTLQVSYQRKVPIITNVDLVVSFKPKLECTLSGKCTKK